MSIDPRRISVNGEPLANVLKSFPKADAFEVNGEKFGESHSEWKKLKGYLTSSLGFKESSDEYTAIMKKWGEHFQLWDKKLAAMEAKNKKDPQADSFAVLRAYDQLPVYKKLDMAIRPNLSRGLEPPNPSSVMANRTQGTNVPNRFINPGTLLRSAEAYLSSPREAARILRPIRQNVSQVFTSNDWYAKERLLGNLTVFYSMLKGFSNEFKKETASANSQANVAMQSLQSEYSGSLKQLRQKIDSILKENDVDNVKDLPKALQRKIEKATARIERKKTQREAEIKEERRIAYYKALQRYYDAISEEIRQMGIEPGKTDKIPTKYKKYMPQKPPSALG